MYPFNYNFIVISNDKNYKDIFAVSSIIPYLYFDINMKDVNLLFDYRQLPIFPSEQLNNWLDSEVNFKFNVYSVYYNLDKLDFTEDLNFYVKDFSKIILPCEKIHIF